MSSSKSVHIIQITLGLTQAIFENPYILQTGLNLDGSLSKSSDLQARLLCKSAGKSISERTTRRIIPSKRIVVTVCFHNYAFRVNQRDTFLHFEFFNEFNLRGLSRATEGHRFNFPPGQSF